MELKSMRGEKQSATCETMQQKTIRIFIFFFLLFYLEFLHRIAICQWRFGRKENWIGMAWVNGLLELETISSILLLLLRITRFRLDDPHRIGVFPLSSLSIEFRNVNKIDVFPAVLLTLNNPILIDVLMINTVDNHQCKNPIRRTSDDNNNFTARTFIVFSPDV